MHAALILTPAACSLLLLAAHYLRSGAWGMVSALVLMAVLLLSRRAWVRPVVLCLLLAGCLVWAQTAVELARFRLIAGDDPTRLLLILGSVTGVSLLAALLLGLPSSARLFAPKEGEANPAPWPRALAFLLCAGSMLLAREMAPMAERGGLLLADRLLPGSGPLFALLMGCYAVWLAGAFLDPVRHTRLRPRVWLVFSAIFFGQLLLGLLGSDVFLLSGRLHLPVPALILGGPLYRGEGLFMPILFAVSLLLLGPAWCSHLCYVGSWDDAASRCHKGKPAHLPPHLLWGGRGLTLGLTVCLALGLRALAVPPLLALVPAALFGLGGVWLMVRASRARGVLVHCTTYCPMGLLANLLGRINPFRMRFGPGCSSCLRCTRACRYGALTKEHVARQRVGLSCTLCGDCAGTCREGVLTYRAPLLSPAVSRALFAALAAALHAVFLGVARI